MVHMIEEGFRNSICFGCLSLKWPQAASKSFFVNESSIEGTIATSGDKTKQLRKLVNGSVGRYSCLLQYLFWLLASKMTSGSLRPRSPYLADVRPSCNSETSGFGGLIIPYHVLSLPKSRILLEVCLFWCALNLLICIYL